METIAIGSELAAVGAVGSLGLGFVGFIGFLLAVCFAANRS